MPEKDDRGWLNHRVHQYGHQYNASRKHQGKSGIQSSEAYKSRSPGKAKRGPWSEQVDHDRADYHKKEAENSSWKNIW